MNNKRLVITSTISLLLVSILLIGSTYAIFTSSEVDEKENVYTTGNLDITYTVSDDNKIMADTTPTSVDTSTLLKPYRIKVTNKGNVAYKFNIILTDTTASNKIDYQYIMTQVGKLEPKLLSDCTNNVLKSDVTILPNTSVDIDVRVWILDTIKNTEMDKSFYAKLSIDGLAVNTDEMEIDNSDLIADYTPNIIEIMKEKSMLDTDIDFSKISSDTNGKGVYIRSGTENDTNPIYYYRGEVYDNNVIFADMCFKMVRTTKTGGIKLIYNGLPDDNDECNATGSSVAIGNKVFNSSYSSPADVGYMYGTRYSYSTSNALNETYLYGSDVTYSNGQYTLTGTPQTGYSQGISNYHYTCGSTSDTCSSIKYIYYVSGSMGYYITLSGGKKVETALSEMLDYNTHPSTIKGNKDTTGTIDNWYYTNIEQAGYADYIEDTVWCNDRSISDLGGWNPNGGSTDSYLYFGSYGRNVSNKTPNLTCERPIDRFTVSSALGNGALEYPVGLLTADEIALAGAVYGTSNSTYYLNSGDWYWAGSPTVFIYGYSYGFFVVSSGLLDDVTVGFSSGVRPSVSLKPGTLINRGTGTYEDPYVVMTK